MSTWPRDPLLNPPLSDWRADLCGRVAWSQSGLEDESWGGGGALGLCKMSGKSVGSAEAWQSPLLRTGIQIIAHPVLPRPDTRLGCYQSSLSLPTHLEGTLELADPATEKRLLPGAALRKNVCISPLPCTNTASAGK
jgi:hypothetical protein